MHAGHPSGARRPISPPSSDPERINIEPARAGYAGIAELARQEQTRCTTAEAAVLVGMVGMVGRQYATTAGSHLHPR